MQTIQISDQLYRRLLRRARSFDETPEDVISRLIDDAQSDGNEDLAQSEHRASPGSVLPVQHYWVPILEVLSENGGSAPSTVVIDALEERMEGTLTPDDHLRLKSGEIRWRNRARFARLRMKERGLLKDSSHRGIWEMTSAGREYLELEASSG